MCGFLKRFPVISPLNSNVVKCVIVGPLTRRRRAGRLCRPFDLASPQRSKDSPPLSTAAVEGSSSSSRDHCKKSGGQKRKYSRLFTTSIAWFRHPRAKLLAWIATLKAAWLGSACVISSGFQIKSSSCFVSTALPGWFQTCRQSLCCFDGWRESVCTAAAGAEQHLRRIFGSHPE